MLQRMPPELRLTSSDRQWSSDQWCFMKLHAKNWDCLWVSFHKNGKAFIPGWDTILHAAREVGTKAKRWREYLRGSMCGLTNGLKLNGALLMGTECLRSPEASIECREPQSCAIQMDRGRVQSLWLNNAAGDSVTETSRHRSLQQIILSIPLWNTGYNSNPESTGRGRDLVMARSIPNHPRPWLWRRLSPWPNFS